MDLEQNRQEHLDKILNSEASKKLIVAGPGTGKTYTFGQVLKKTGGENNIAMTFIRRLVEDMSIELSEHAKIYTFHKYCKMTLHQQLGSFTLFPYLPIIIESDATILGLGFNCFPDKFQLLQTDCPDVEFYMSRSDYYSAISFDDCVFRLLSDACEKADILPHFDLLVVDEFQDFNALEVALIDQLEMKGNVLIVGDDDQSVYTTLRNASPKYLRNKFASGDYETFTLPYCSRCTEVIVNASKSIVANAKRDGRFGKSIEKPFDCYLPDKKVDNESYPTIKTVRCTMLSVVSSYIANSIEYIREDDVIESNKPNKIYYTVLIVGPHYCLREVAKTLTKKFRRVIYESPREESVLIEDGYKLLSEDINSNLGWRIILECSQHNFKIKDIMSKSIKGEMLIDILNQEFIDSHKKALDILGKIKERNELGPFEDRFLSDLLNSDHVRVVEYFSPKENEDDPEYDVTEPTICLTTYVGSKGLSAGHVFIIGLNEGDLPKDNSDISDQEISRFLVSLTRTRKQCHLIANKWLNAPFGRKGFIQPKNRSRFINWIPNNLLTDFGDISAKQVKRLFD